MAIHVINKGETRNGRKVEEMKPAGLYRSYEFYLAHINMFRCFYVPIPSWYNTKAFISLTMEEKAMRQEMKEHEQKNT